MRLNKCIGDGGREEGGRGKGRRGKGRRVMEERRAERGE